MINIARQRLHDLASGHPLAMEGLREYQAVVDAAIALILANRVIGCPEAYELKLALKKGGWLP